MRCVRAVPQPRRGENRRCLHPDNPHEAGVRAQGALWLAGGCGALREDIPNLSNITPLRQIGAVLD